MKIVRIYFLRIQLHTRDLLTPLKHFLHWPFHNRFIADSSSPYLLFHIQHRSKNLWMTLLLDHTRAHNIHSHCRVRWDRYTSYTVSWRSLPPWGLYTNVEMGVCISSSYWGQHALYVGIQKKLDRTAKRLTTDTLVCNILIYICFDDLVHTLHLHFYLYSILVR